jgi:hypothetical protein
VNGIWRQISILDGRTVFLLAKKPALAAAGSVELGMSPIDCHMDVFLGPILGIRIAIWICGFIEA